MSTFTPRLVTSRQWTDLPADFLAKVGDVFRNQFRAESARGEFLVEGRIFPEEICARVGYVENGRLKQINFEASMDLQKNLSGDGESQTMMLLYTCIDALGSLLEEYFQAADGEEIDVPNAWRAYEFEGDTVYLQYSTLNTRLEDEANRLLGLDGKKLFNEEFAEEAEGEDALKKAEIDADLAFEIQKRIRAGQYPHPIADDAGSSDDELN